MNREVINMTISDISNFLAYFGGTYPFGYSIVHACSWEDGVQARRYKFLWSALISKTTYFHSTFSKPSRENTATYRRKRAFFSCPTSGSRYKTTFSYLIAACHRSSTSSCSCSDILSDFIVTRQAKKCECIILLKHTMSLHLQSTVCDLVKLPLSLMYLSKNTVADLADWIPRFLIFLFSSITFLLSCNRARVRSACPKSALSMLLVIEILRDIGRLTEKFDALK